MASKVIIYCGGRGSGKTLSMSYWGLMKLIAGKNVWANYPIKFGIRDYDQSITYYQSQPLEIDDLVALRPDIKDGLILLDELNLWASNRGSMGLVNRLLNAWMQLIRKRKLDLFITVQSFDSLDRMVRWQCDATISCTDLKFRYHNLPEGAYIGQDFTDRSGMFTGRPLTNAMGSYYWEAYKRNTQTRIFHGKTFWGIYDSWTEFDILKAMTKYEIQREVKIIGADGLVEPVFSEAQNITADQVKMLQLRNDLLTDNPEGLRFSRGELFNMMAQQGIGGSPRYYNRLLGSQGFLMDGETFILPVDDNGQ